MPALNPFKVFTPEDLNTQETIDLFVEVPYLNKVQDIGNTMLSGPRGSGKSMLFRYMKVDCQMMVNDGRLHDLPFFGVLISIKKAADLIELRRLKDYTARTVLGEHALATYVGAQLFEAIAEVGPVSVEGHLLAFEEVYKKVVSLMSQCGGSPLDMAEKPKDARGFLSACKNLCEDAYTSVNQFAKRLAFSDSLSYQGPLCDYLTFLYPIVKMVRRLPFMPVDRPIFLMFDDADHLSEDQTRVLNSWLVARTQSDVSFKVASQLQYKTSATVSGGQAQAPHDFQKINMADIYTTKDHVYINSVRSIVEKRLKRAGIDVLPKDFFPSDRKQDKRIKEVAARIRDRWPEEGRGYRVSDDVLRYARPDYIKELGGTSKSTSTFIYAGFNELVHISSGQVRYFLEPAAKMFDEHSSLNNMDLVRHIDPSIQNKVVREEANALMFDEFEDHDKSEVGSSKSYQGDIVRLRNLVVFLGGFFYRKLVSNESERRVFSIVVTGGPENDVERVLRLGIHLGYFHPSSIGNKEGTGRVRLYVLTRRLAPYFNLDPSSFAGYQFFTNRVLHNALDDPDRMLSRIKRHGFDWVGKDQQAEMF